MKMFKLILMALLVPSTFAAEAPVKKETERVLLDVNNTVVFRGTVTESSVLKAQIELADLVIKRGTKDYPIYIVIDSPGGSISDGVDFIEFVSTLKNVKTVILFAASMASAFVQAIPGERLAVKSAWMMFHRAKGQFSGQFETGEVESRLKMAQKLVLRMERTNASRLGISLEEYKSRVKDEYWLDTADMLSDRAIDKEVQIVCTTALYKKKDTVNVSSFFGNASVIFSGCPLFRTPL